MSGYRQTNCVSMQDGEHASACTSSFGMSGVNAHALIGGCPVEWQRRSGQVRAGKHAWYAFGRALAAPDVIQVQQGLRTPLARVLCQLNTYSL